MKKLLLSLLLIISVYAEPTFDQVQSMIKDQQYKQAILALTIIDNNHPGSSKVQYTLAQANAGLGNLSTAREHLLRAKALNPKLDFVSPDAVTSLEQAIIPQVKLIKPVESGFPWWGYILIILSLGLFLWFWKQTSRQEPLPKDEPKRPHHPGYGFTTRRSNSPSVKPVVTEVHHYHQDTYSDKE